MISDEWTDRANGDDAGILEELGSSIWKGQGQSWSFRVRGVGWWRGEGG